MARASRTPGDRGDVAIIDGEVSAVKDCVTIFANSNCYTVDVAIHPYKLAVYQFCRLRSVSVVIFLSM